MVPSRSLVRLVRSLVAIQRLPAEGRYLALASARIEGTWRVLGVGNVYP